tara:strand:- start:8500 stop:8934 length:435 start_codon:yes stop_codon:yes gene_type:complete
MVKKLLEAYISFLPTKSQILIEDCRHGAIESFTILSVIHHTSHEPDVPEELSRLIITECQNILDKLSCNNEGISSMASLSIRPDKCRDECFHNWEDYDRIQSKLPYFELLIGGKKKLEIRPNPNKKPVESWGDRDDTNISYGNN